nr:calcium/sodium antiporter [Nannocystis sp.]
MSTTVIILFFVGLVLIVGGSELLVRGASRLATAAGISPLVVGLTVVAFGTSSPELAVGIRSALEGTGAVTVGNVIGANIINMLLILGLAAVILPLEVPQRLVRLDVPLLIGVGAALALLAWDGSFSRLDGALLIAGAVAYIAFCVRASRQESLAVREDYEEEFAPPEQERRGVGYHLRSVLFALLGLGLLFYGSNLLIDSAMAFARALGVGELLIGLTVVAIGTAMPEIATTVTASLRGERDIAIGAVIGSVQFNMLGVVGLAAAVAPGGIEVPRAALVFDMPVMIAVFVACLPIFFIGGRVSRAEGALFLFYYAAYTAYLIQSASPSGASKVFHIAMLGFVLPITALTLLVLSVRWSQRARREPSPAPDRRPPAGSSS